MRKAAHAAIAVRGVLIIEEGEGMRGPAARRDIEIFKEGAADDMRRLSAHVADADIDARLAEIDRLQLGVGIGQMQDADIAEAADVVEVVVSRQRHAWRDARCGGDAKPTQEIPAVHLVSSFPGAAQHEVMRCRPGIVTNSEPGAIPDQRCTAARCTASGKRNHYRITPARHAVCCSLAWAIDALAKASACLAWATAASKSPAAAAFLAAVHACSG